MIGVLPKHIAIIMDGNGRWAKARHLPRIAGHREGLKAVKRVVQACGEKKIEVLTLFAFSSENWNRPEDEVTGLFNLFLTALQSEVKDLHQNQVQLRILGNTSRFDSNMLKKMQESEALTKNNMGLKLVIALDYGGRWDIVQATKKIVNATQHHDLTVEQIDEKLFDQQVSLSDLPPPDLFIRTGGEYRISNFLLWQLAYTELYFTNQHWPDFDEAALNEALNFYRTRERRFGKVSA